MKKASIRIKNPYTWPSYTVVIGNEIIQGFYSKKEAIELRNRLNSK